MTLAIDTEMKIEDEITMLSGYSCYRSRIIEIDMVVYLAIFTSMNSFASLFRLSQPFPFRKKGGARGES